MQVLRAAFVSLAALLVLGCASMPGPLQSTDKLDPTKGVLLAALTTDENSQVMDAWFFYRKKGSTEELRLDAFGMGGLLMKPNDFAGKDLRKGRLIALPLEPGEYELFNWMLYVTRLGGYGYLSPKTPPPPHPFTIRAGEVTYLGGLHIDPIVGKNSFGIAMVFGGNPDITDQSTRDLPLLKEKYPNLSANPVRNAVPDGSHWKIN